jgi:hypothetical protein
MTAEFKAMRGAVHTIAADLSNKRNEDFDTNSTNFQKGSDGKSREDRMNRMNRIKFPGARVRSALA